MSECPKKVKFSFNPKEKELLNDSRALILWACIKTGHITDQYFDDNVKDVVDMLNDIDLNDYDEFIKIIEHSGLKDFGIFYEGFAGSYRKRDHEFWKGIWEYLIGKKILEIEINIKDKKMVETKWLIEIKDISPTMYYAGYEVKDKINCPSGETESSFYKFTEDVYSAKQFISKKLAEDILENLPAVKFYCGVFEHSFGI